MVTISKPGKRRSSDERRAEIVAFIRRYQKLGRSPTNLEIATHVGVSATTVTLDLTILRRKGTIKITGKREYRLIEVPA